MKSKHIKQWLSILMAAALTLGSPAFPIDTAAAAEPAKAAEAVTLAESDDREINFNKDWKFLLDRTENLEASGVNYNDSSWEDINLPHDFSITEEFSNNYEAESGFLPGGTGWYRKSVVFPASYSGKSIILNFDGVYNNAYVYVNGNKLGEHHYGYTNFSFDISGEVTCDGSTENVIAVKAVSEFPSSRWYSGAGIYRDVTLTVTDPVHVSLNGTYVTTPNLENEKNSSVAVKVETTVQNDSNASESVSVCTTIQDAEGNAVSSPVTNDLTIAQNSSETQEQTATVNKPKLWDCDNPNLYYVQTEILVGGKVVDTYTTEFGFRYFNYDVNTGFSLNGKNVKMKGVCLHHDQGALGAAAYRDAIYRQVVILKEMGCNAIRTSHNAHAKVLLDVCNELGMLVMDEVYDGWSYHKNGNSRDFGAYWNEKLGADNHLIGGLADEKWVQFALESFINRDKNDPSVVMWSIGNEINFGVPSTTGEQYVKEYEGYATDMVNWIQAIDPTKPITHGDNNVAGNENDLRTHVDAILADNGGVVGLNYSPGQYNNIHNRYPNWPLIGTETVSAINSRGIYSTTGEYGKPGDYQNTAYDTHAVSWGQTARQAWLPVIQNDFMIGTFVWTGFDYIGEPTNWNGLNSGSVSGDEKAIPNSSYFGIIDTAGFPKDSFYYYSSQWREDKTTLHIVPGCWNEEDLLSNGGRVQVDLYSNAAKVELLLNGEVIGTATRDSRTTTAGYEYGFYRTVSNNADKCVGRNADSGTNYNDMAAQFYVMYEAGTLSAKAYDENGKEITDTMGINTVKTNSDRGSVLKVTPEKTEIQADGSSLAYISVDILDKDGEFASQAKNNIRFSLTGNGEIAGVDNGNASTVDKYQQKSVLTSKKTANIDAFSGKALVIVRSTEEAGGFVLRVDSNGMETQYVKIDTIGKIEGEVYLERYELQTEYTVDMGTQPVLMTTANCIMSDDSKIESTITWDTVTEDIYNNPGIYQINGTFECKGEQIPVIAVLHVNPIIVAAKNYSKATMPGVVPTMPETVSGILTDGRLYGSYPVTWETISDTELSKVGDFVTVKGRATISDTVTLPTKLTIRVAETNEEESKNIAPACSELSQTSLPSSDNLRAIIDGNTILSNAQGSGEAANRRWTNWNSALTSGASITFKWDDIQNISYINLYHYTDGSIALPDSVSFRYFDGTASRDLGESDITATEIDESNNNKATYTLTKPINAVSLTISFIGHRKTDGAPPYVGLVECQIFNSGITYEENNTAALDTLKINNANVALNPDNYNYTVKIDGRSATAVVDAIAETNPSITVLPADSKGIIRIIVQSEDDSTINTYKIQTESEDDDKINEMKPEVDKIFETAADKEKEELNYTADSWSAFQSALDALKTAWETAGPEEIKSAMNNLNTTMGKLTKKTNPPVVNTTLLQTGKTYPSDDKTADYEVMTSSASGGTVTFVKPASKTNKNFTVPDTVKIQGLTYTVIKIEKNAFKNNKNLKTVTIGKNITEIGASAFAGAKKLKTIKIQSTVLNKVGKKAFKGINAKAKIKVPKAKLKAYKKTLKGKGQKSTVKITK